MKGAKANRLSLTGRVALVTGANHGIGAATALALGKSGAQVVLSYLRSPASPGVSGSTNYGEERSRTADHVVEILLSEGHEAIALEADLRDTDTPSTLFDAAETRFGPVEILVNNASGWIPDSFVPSRTDALGRSSARVSTEIFEQQFAVDAMASAQLIAELAIRHENHGLSWGRIIGLTSGGLIGSPGEVSYGAAKAALESYTLSAAMELADRGITANVVHPPITDTGWITSQVRQEVEASPHLIHIAQPEDVAEFIAFLASDMAKLVTGNIIHLR